MKTLNNTEIKFVDNSNGHIFETHVLDYLPRVGEYILTEENKEKLYLVSKIIHKQRMVKDKNYQVFTTTKLVFLKKAKIKSRLY